jgi:hypothetical protein
MTLRISFASSDLLSSNRQIRIKALQRAISKQPLLTREEDKWLALVQKRALKDREYVDLLTDLDATPEALVGGFEKPRNINADDMMPEGSEYHRRFIGAVPVSAGLDTFIGGPLAAARKELIARHPKTALRRIAFAALWQPLIPFDLLKSLKIKDVTQLLDANDPFSLLCGFELCCAKLSMDANFADLGSKFLVKLLTDGKKSEARCNLFSACAIIATVKIHGKGNVTGMSLFWVRLAALSHAGVLAEGLSGVRDTTKFLRWAVQTLYPNYLWTSAIDLHEAPRWNPEWLDPEHLYAELVGRVQGALALLPKGERPKAWITNVHVALKRLTKTGKLLASTFAGPFDDFREGTVILSSSIDAFKEIEEKLATASKLSDIPGLFALADASQPSDHVVTHVQRILNAPAEEGIAGKQELIFLRLCARIGRVTRDEPIANSVINRCLFIARKPKRTESVTDIFEVMVEACAAHQDVIKYRAQLGEAAAKLCFAIEGSSDLKNLV